MFMFSFSDRSKGRGLRVARVDANWLMVRKVMSMSRRRIRIVVGLELVELDDGWRDFGLGTY